jgi:hypothetical protein
MNPEGSRTGKGVSMEMLGFGLRKKLLLLLHLLCRGKTSLSLPPNAFLQLHTILSKYEQI